MVNYLIQLFFSKRNRNLIDYHQASSFEACLRENFIDLKIQNTIDQIKTTHDRLLNNCILNQALLWIG